MHAVVNELRGVVVYLVVQWPNTGLGLWARQKYWRRRTGLRNIFVGKGTDLGDCRLLVLGENLQIGENVLFVVDGPPIGYPVFIGSNVSIARSVYLRSGNHRFDDRTTPIVDQGHWSAKVEHNGAVYSAVIDNDAWIGANVIILSGAMVGEGSVVAAGSIITRSTAIPPYSIAAGNPARVISTRK